MKKEITVSYEGQTKVIKYFVNEVLPINAIYKGEDITIYRNETYDFSKVFVTVLFNNGEEKEISLKDFSVSEIDYSLTEENRTIKVTYLGIEEEINYNVTNRKIEEYKDYDLIDNLNIFNDESIKIRFVNDKYIVHNGQNLESLPKGQKANKSTFNRYWSINIYNGKPTKIYFYLVNESIYCEIVEE